MASLDLTVPPSSAHSYPFSHLIIMEPSKYDRYPWSYQGPPKKKQPIPTGGLIKHGDGTIERYYGNKPSRYSRKGKTRQDGKATTHDQMSLDRSADASTCE
jgi:hypothetical protein